MDKPIIRHCKNCQWASCAIFTDGLTCTVKYKYIINEMQK